MVFRVVVPTAPAALRRTPRLFPPNYLGQTLLTNDLKTVAATGDPLVCVVCLQLEQNPAAFDTNDPSPAQHLLADGGGGGVPDIQFDAHRTFLPIKKR